MRKSVVFANGASLLLTSLMAVGRYSASSSTSAEYVASLQAANEFMHAWLERDAATGIKLMSARLRDSRKTANAKQFESSLNQYMIGLSNPHHMAFELGRGHASSKDRFVFPVVVYEWADGMPTADAYRGSMELVHTRVGWRVDRLPPSSDALE